MTPVLSHFCSVCLSTKDNDKYLTALPATISFLFLTICFLSLMGRGQKHTFVGVYGRLKKAERSLTLLSSRSGSASSPFKSGWPWWLLWLKNMVERAMSGSQHRLKRLVAQACLLDPESSGEKSTYPSGGTLGEYLSWHGRGEGPMWAQPLSQPTKAPGQRKKPSWFCRAGQLPASHRQWVQWMPHGAEAVGRSLPGCLTHKTMQYHETTVIFSDYVLG